MCVYNVPLMYLLQHVIESYQFKFKYTDNGPQMDILR